MIAAGVRVPVGEPSNSSAIADSVRRVTLSSASVHVDINRLIADLHRADGRDSQPSCLSR